MMVLDARSLEAARVRLSDRTTRLVGWGSGSVFDYFQSRCPLPLAYLVDNDAARWGGERRGVQVHSPDRLSTEDPRRAVVIIYSAAWPDIQRQLAAMGSYLPIPAAAAFAEPSTLERLSRADAIAARSVATRRPSFRRTIVVQGPIWPDVTTRVLRVMAAQNPDDAIVLSTWNDTDPEQLKTASAEVDDVVLSPRPLPVGIQNRNAQIVSTRAGIERAIDAGATTILKTRTDLAPMASAIFDRADAWSAGLDTSVARAAGLRGRIVVPQSFTRKYLLYHPSDLVMVGAADDLRLYWSAPLDPRTGDLLSPEWMDRPLAIVNMDGNPTESYLGLQFCRTTGRATPGTTRDSWQFYRDLFVVVNNDAFELLWYKNLSLPDITVTSGVRQLVDHAFWHRLQRWDETVEAELRHVDIERTVLRSLAA